MEREITINAEKYTGDFAELFRETAEYGEQINIWTAKGSLVLLPEEEFRGIFETARINSIPSLHQKLIDGLNTPENDCVSANEVDF